jgi:hypothetical protein
LGYIFGNFSQTHLVNLGGTDVCTLATYLFKKYIIDKNGAKKIVQIFVQNTAWFCQNRIIAKLALRKTPNFWPKIGENCGHNIDPWLRKKGWEKIAMVSLHTFNQSINQSIRAFNPGANPTIASYNATVVNFYNAASSLVRFKTKNIFFSI